MRWFGGERGVEIWALLYISNFYLRPTTSVPIMDHTLNSGLHRYYFCSGARPLSCHDVSSRVIHSVKPQDKKFSLDTRHPND